MRPQDLANQETQLPPAKKPGSRLMGEAPAEPKAKKPEPIGEQKMPEPAAKPPVRPKSANLVSRPLGAMLDLLPAPVSTRVNPLYQSYAAPTVQKVDGLIFAVADRGSQILGGARAKLFKVKSQDDVSGMNRPGLVARMMASVERSVDRMLPPPRRLEEPNTEDTSEEGSDEELSSFRKGLQLLETIRMRAHIHSEVQIIVMKVHTKVWFDLHVVGKYQKFRARAESLRLRARTRALGAKDACLAYEKGVENCVVGKYTLAKSAVGRRTAAVTTKALALKTSLATSLERAKDSLQAKALPYASALKKRMAPLTNRLTAWLQKLREAQRKCIAYALEKKYMLASKAKARIAPVEEYVAEKYDITVATAGKYTKRTLTYARVKIQKVLGRDRAAKVGGVLNRYTAMIARSVGAHAA